MTGRSPQDPGQEERRPDREPRDAAYWAMRVERLEVADVPEGAVNLNVSARREVGALQGFGQLWQKTYRVSLPGAVTPAEVVKVWKERFPEFQPQRNRFYPSMAGVEPGEMLLINAAMGGIPVYTGVRVIYADEESFTVMTPQGHPESGWNTFSAHRDDDGRIVAQIQSLARANDPIYELGFRLVGSTEQERIWTHVLKSLSAHFGMMNAPVTLSKVLVDPKVQWSQAGNVWHNAGARSVLHAMAALFRRSPAQNVTDPHNRRGKEMLEIELSAGTIEYEDTGGNGPVVVLLNGFLMDASLWDGVIADLSVDHRCLAPTLPMGAHRRPVRPGADLSLRAIARLAAEFLDRLDLRDVTLVGNDTGGALVQLLVCRDAARVDRIVLASCDAFDNYPAGLAGKALVLSGKLPAAVFGAFMQQMRLRPLRRLPIAFGWLTKRGDEATARWMKPILRQAGIRRDAVRMLRAVSAEPDLMLEAAECLPAFDRPALVVWAAGDRVMPPEHGRRLTEILPQGRLIEVEDSYTLIPQDQPGEFARAIRRFVQDTP